MTALRTMSIKIIDPKAERLIVDLASQNLIEIDEPETAQEEFMRLGREIREWRKNEGLPEEDPMTMEEIVAICKEVRAEMYAEEQAQKMAAYR